MCLKESYYKCGKCVECIEELRTMWSIRCQEQARDSLFVLFGMITYDEDNVPYVEYKGENLMSLCWLDVQKFLKRFRKANPFIKFKYLISGEYGTLHSRPHYHPLIFVESVSMDNVNYRLYSESKLKKIRYRYEQCVKSPVTSIENYMRESWAKGFLNLSLARKGVDACSHYATKYMLGKVNAPVGVEDKPYIVSHGLGIGYLERRRTEFQFDDHLRFYKVPYDGLIPHPCECVNLPSVPFLWTTNYLSSYSNNRGKYSLPLYYRRKDFEFYPFTIRKLIAEQNILKQNVKYCKRIEKLVKLSSEAGFVCTHDYLVNLEQVKLDKFKRRIKFKLNQ